MTTVPTEKNPEGFGQSHDNRSQACLWTVSLIRESSVKPGAFVSHSFVYPRTVPGRVGERMNDFAIIF